MTDMSSQLQIKLSLMRVWAKSWAGLVFITFAEFRVSHLLIILKFLFRKIRKQNNANVIKKSKNSKCEGSKQNDQTFSIKKKYKRIISTQ